MLVTIHNEVPFQILSSSFSIGPSQTGYELQVGADSKTFSTLFSVGANTPRMVTNVANGSYFRLKNNVGDVVVNWRTSCVTEGGGSGTELQPVADFPLNAVEGTVISYTGSSSASGVYQYDGNEWTAVGADDLSAYWTSAETQSAIDEALSAYTPTSGFSTINGSAITNGGNIVIQGGGDVTKAYVDSAVTGVQNQLDTIDEVIPAAIVDLNERVDEISASTPSIDLSGYYTSAQTENAISAATSGKADAANIKANTGNFIFPKWNNQGIISGVSQQVFKSYLLVNDGGTGGYFFMNTSKYDAQNKALKIYTPLSAGTAGEILVSTGNGAPVWSAATQDMVTSTDVRHMVKLSQAAYDQLSVKDPETFYIIVNE